MIKKSCRVSYALASHTSFSLNVLERHGYLEALERPSSRADFLTFKFSAISLLSSSAQSIEHAAFIPTQLFL